MSRHKKKKKIVNQISEPADKFKTGILFLCVVVSTVSTLSETHFRTHTRFQRGLDIEILSLAGIALCTGGHLLLFGPLAAGAALERRAANAVPGTFAVARSGQGTRRAGAGARRGSRAGRSRAGTGRRAGGAGAGAGRAGLSRGGGRLGRSRSARLRRGRSLGKDTTRAIRAGSLSGGSTTTKTEADTEGSTDGRRGFSGRGGRRTRAATAATTATTATATTTERGSTRASFSALLHEVGGITVILDIITGVGETKVDAVGSGATVDIGDEHAGQVGTLLERGGLFGTLGGTTLDSDGSAVHVHLTVTNAVEPGPGQGVLAGLDTVRDGEVEVGGDLVGLAATDVTLSVDRATTFERLDDHPVGVLGGLAVGG